ncbi:MAG: hypothetical protein J5858_09545 [Lentisphaeria bacterium]|nr:hypothetical protein [Lentisphaeria bacterium]
MKSFGKILCVFFLAVSAAVLFFAAAAGIQYYRVSHSNAKVELVSGPDRKETNPELGEKLIFETVFRVPWGIRPLSLTVTPAPGSQLTAQPVFRRQKLGWGSNLWKCTVLLQCYREGVIGESPAQAVFSNKQILDLKLPALQIAPPGNLQGDQLELAGEMELDRKDLNRNWLLGILAGILILGIIGLLVLKFLKREKKRVISPWEKALSAIQELLNQVRAGSAQPEISIARLTDIVREYMERRFHLRAERQTTAEFMADLEGGNGGLDSRHRDFLRNFLSAADLVKFAKVPADKNLFENAAVKAEELIRETAPRESGKEDEK